MSSLRTTQAILKPRKSGVYQNGLWINEQDDIPSIIEGSLQPIRQSDIISLPEGRREINENTVRFYTDTELHSWDQGQNPDILEIAGIEYEVLSRASWNNGIINHHKYILTRKKQNA